ncbi:hypothetical protein [Hamadaea tsunoensis]|uniref:hypothetical protein n=1 Tax=Hamadaea tsunoensis TaxID=53368 RepID=UPI0003F70A80|nr:hypothetical protein [Hamadaea tsunoensis]
MALSSRLCPDCGRRVRTPFQKTLTGREVCPDCATALRAGTTAGAMTGDVGVGMGVWAMLMRRFRRRSS